MIASVRLSFVGSVWMYDDKFTASLFKLSGSKCHKSQGQRAQYRLTTFVSSNRGNICKERKIRLIFPVYTE